MPSKKEIYRITYIQQASIYEIYAEKITQSEVFGFVEVKGLIFNTGTVVVDPSEEKLRSEFKNVKRTLIPMQTILRIDIIDAGQEKMIAKIRGTEGHAGQAGNIHNLFPEPPHKKDK